MRNTHCRLFVVLVTGLLEAVMCTGIMPAGAGAEWHVYPDSIRGYDLWLR